MWPFQSGSYAPAWEPPRVGAPRREPDGGADSGAGAAERPGQRVPTQRVGTRGVCALVAVVLGFPMVAASAETQPPATPPPFDSPYLRPEMRELMAAVTLHLSFDAESMTSDMAEGPKYTPKLVAAPGPATGGPRFAPGLLGKALVLGSGAAVYPRAGNVLLGKRGALAVWIKPEGWQRPNDRNCLFAMTTDAAFYLQRQGPLLGEDAKVRRHEVIQYLARDEGRRLAGASDYSAWTNGRWYLLVANWSWPTFELSVNGEPFRGQSLRAVPGKDVFGDLVVGDRGGSPRGLLDELMAFRRPLNLDEAKLLYRLLNPARAGTRQLGP